MEARCYNGGDGRTRMNEIRFAGSDFAAAVLMVLSFAAVIATGMI